MFPCGHEVVYHTTVVLFSMFNFISNSQRSPQHVLLKELIILSFVDSATADKLLLK
jgi:hypothetical protein